MFCFELVCTRTQSWCQNLNPLFASELKSAPKEIWWMEIIQYMVLSNNVAFWTIEFGNKFRNVKWFSWINHSFGALTSLLVGHTEVPLPFNQSRTTWYWCLLNWTSTIKDNASSAVVDWIKSVLWLPHAAFFGPSSSFEDFLLQLHFASS